MVPPKVPEVPRKVPVVRRRARKAHPQQDHRLPQAIPHQPPAPLMLTAGGSSAHQPAAVDRFARRVRVSRFSGEIAGLPPRAGARPRAVGAP